MKILILSDIHGNLEAISEVKNSIGNNVDGMIILGDIVDYGPHSNEVIKLIDDWRIPVLCNIRGNHEQALMCDMLDKFSTDRGRNSLKHVKEQLDDFSWTYLETCMEKTGCIEMLIDNRRCLVVHGSLEDIYWKAIEYTDDLERYKKYDYVFSGHSHIPHLFYKFYKSKNNTYRNKKRTVFINPGSIGQPRNHNSCAQFAVWDTILDSIELKAIEYNISKEQEAFTSEIDSFYRDRLERGI